MNFIPIRKINVTNVWPTEPAPLGLNYYVAIRELQYPSEDIQSWNSFLSRAYDCNPSIAGTKTPGAFCDWAQNLQPLTAMEREVLWNLGYNPIYYMHGIGPVIYGNDVVGTRWTLPQLMTVFEVMANVKNAVDNLIGTEQMSLFFMDDPEIHRVQSIIYTVITNHRACRDLYCQDLNAPVVWVDRNDSEVTFTISIHLVMRVDPFIFKLKLRNAKIGCEYTVAKELATEYEAMRHLFDIRNTGILLEDEQCKN
jgi:hypothetical protein